MRRPLGFTSMLVAVILGGVGVLLVDQELRPGRRRRPTTTTRPGARPTTTTSPDDGELTRAGVQLTIPQVIQFAYDAGFHSEDQLVTVVSIGIAESSLYSQHRHWHPEYGSGPPPR